MSAADPHVPEWIRAARRRLSQSALAGLLGVKRFALYEAGAGRRELSPEAVHRLLAVLGDPPREARPPR